MCFLTRVGSKVVQHAERGLTVAKFAERFGLAITEVLDEATKRSMYVRNPKSILKLEDQATLADIFRVRAEPEKLRA